MRTLIPLAAMILPTYAAAFAQNAPPVLIVPGASMLHVDFEEGQTNFSSGQNIIIREIVGAAKTIPGSAMVLCYRFGPNRAADYLLMDKRFSSVAAALKKQGAPTILKGTHDLCQTLTSKSPHAKASVSIHRLAPAK
ncbi:hypothetical protein JI743_05725 [Sphingopyxis sp. DHUNG17]|uniref:hypothetical protein n=1 Tax=Sphingopyxis jiangsuensis TaxID=2871171 RepID=UPI00191CE010|nr:hypothetical protein [Sphingopyxis lutea]MBL0768298.1 hypothetical protein [Sphingopyxis lutea]